MKREVRIRMVLLSVFMFCMGIAVHAAEEPVVYNSYTEGNELHVFVGNVAGTKSAACQIGTVKCEEVSVQEAGSLETYILVDNSLSIDSKYHGTIREILEKLVGSRAEQETVTIATFDTQLHYLVQKSQDQEELAQTVTGITYENLDTKVTDVMYALCRELEADPFDGLRRIVLISDGAEYSSVGYTRQEMRTELQKLGYPVYTIGCTYRDNTKELEEMFSISRLTGASAIWLDEVQDAEAIVNTVNACRSAVEVSIAVPEALRDGSAKGVKLDFQTDEGARSVSTSEVMPFLEAEGLAQVGEPGTQTDDGTDETDSQPGDQSDETDTQPDGQSDETDGGPGAQSDETDSQPGGQSDEPDSQSDETDGELGAQPDETDSQPGGQSDEPGIEPDTQTGEPDGRADTQDPAALGQPDEQEETEDETTAVVGAAWQPAPVGGGIESTQQPEQTQMPARELDVREETEDETTAPVGSAWQPAPVGGGIESAQQPTDGPASVPAAYKTSDDAGTSNPEQTPGGTAASDAKQTPGSADASDPNKTPDVADASDPNKTPDTAETSDTAEMSGQAESDGALQTDAQAASEDESESERGEEGKRKQDPLMAPMLIVLLVLLVVLLLRRKKAGQGGAGTSREKKEKQKKTKKKKEELPVTDLREEETHYEDETNYEDEETRFEDAETMMSRNAQTDLEDAETTFRYDETEIDDPETSYRTRGGYEDEGTLILSGEELDQEGAEAADFVNIRLTDMRNPTRITEVPLSESISVGRSASANQAVFEYEKSVSSRHCEIIRRGGCIFVRDLNSTNGTWVDDERVEGELELYSGAVLKMGRLEVIFEIV